MDIGHAMFCLEGYITNVSQFFVFKYLQINQGDHGTENIGMWIHAKEVRTFNHRTLEGDIDTAVQWKMFIYLWNENAKGSF